MEKIEWLVDKIKGAKGTAGVDLTKVEVSEARVIRIRILENP